MYRVGFDHIKSSTVDVVKHNYGEFVQVWDAPFKTLGRRLLLTYIRCEDNVSNISTYEYPKIGAFSIIVKSSTQIKKQYRNSNQKSRVEMTLQNGNILISDELENLAVETVFTVDFNFKKLSPKGRKLGDQAVMKRQAENKRYFVSTYQKVDDEPRLAMVKEYLGKNVVNTSLYDFATDN